MSGNRYQVFFLKEGASPDDLSEENLIDAGVLPFNRKLEPGKCFIDQGINYETHFVAIAVNHDSKPPEVTFRQIGKMEIPAKLTKKK